MRSRHDHQGTQACGYHRRRGSSIALRPVTTINSRSPSSGVRSAMPCGKCCGRHFIAAIMFLSSTAATGEDAFFLSEQGVSALCCDASQHMITRAEQRLQHQQLPARVAFRHLPTERIGELAPEASFDGAFSNFSGLNCVADLASTAADLSALVKPGGSLVLCLSTRICLIEILHYGSRGQWKKAVRRCGGQAKAKLGGADLTIFYSHAARRSSQLRTALPASFATGCRRGDSALLSRTLGAALSFSFQSALPPRIRAGTPASAAHQR